MPQRRKIQEASVSEDVEDAEADVPRGTTSTCDADHPREAALRLGELLATRVADHFDTTSLAALLVPGLCDRLATEIQIDALRSRVLELLALKLANDEVLIAAVASKLAELL